MPRTASQRRFNFPHSTLYVIILFFLCYLFSCFSWGAPSKILLVLYSVLEMQMLLRELQGTDMEPYAFLVNDVLGTAIPKRVTVPSWDVDSRRYDFKYRSRPPLADVVYCTDFIIRTLLRWLIHKMGKASRRCLNYVFLSFLK